MKKVLLVLAIFTAALVASTQQAPVNEDAAASRRPKIQSTPITWREGDVRFKVTCDYSHSLSDDPIVFPNQPGASHLHDFIGNRSVNAYTTTYQALQAGTTNCNDLKDKASYWNPAVYISPLNGPKIKRDAESQTVYYRRGTKPGTIQPIPAGLKIVAGHSMSNPSAPTGRSGWQCNTLRTPQASPTSPVKCTYNLTMVIEFPDCWDGINLDSADHRSHMAYATGGDGQTTASYCPPSHPIPLPEVTTYTHYGDIPNGYVVSLPQTPQPLDPTHGVHGDFFNGWDVARMQERTDTCLNGFQKCDSGG